MPLSGRSCRVEAETVKGRLTGYKVWEAAPEGYQYGSIVASFYASYAGAEAALRWSRARP